MPILGRLTRHPTPARNHPPRQPPVRDRCATRDVPSVRVRRGCGVREAVQRERDRRPRLPGRRLRVEQFKKVDFVPFLEKKPVRVFTSRPDPPRFGFSDGKAQRGGTERESEGVG